MRLGECCYFLAINAPSIIRTATIMDIHRIVYEFPLFTFELDVDVVDCVVDWEVELVIDVLVDELVVLVGLPV